MSSLQSSYMGAKGATAMARGMSPERFAERSEAYASKEASDQKLKVLKGTEPTDQDIENQASIQSKKLEVAMGQLDDQKRQQNLQSTYQAFQLYDKDKFNVKHFNQLLTDLEGRGAKLFSQISRVDQLNTTDIKMMREEGDMNEAQINAALKDPRVKGSFVRITHKDGTTTFGNMDALKNFAGGYNDYADQQELARQTTTQQIMYMEGIGRDSDKMSIQAWNETRQDFPNAEHDNPAFIEAYQARYNELLASRGRGGYENATEMEQRVFDVLEKEGLKPGTQEWIDRKVELTRELEDYKKRGVGKRNLEVADAAEAELAEMPFFNQVQGEDKIERKDLTRSEESVIERKIREIETLGKQKLDTPTRKALLQIKNLAHLGGKATELTDDQTGLWDSFIHTAKQYIFDEVEGIQASSAFAEYSNMSRHALFGSVLPAAEIKSHIQSFGSMGMQRGPILEHLRNSVEKLKNTYEALSLLENQFVFEWRTGMTESQLDETIRKLDRQLFEIDIVSKDLPIPVTTTPIKPGYGQPGSTFESKEDEDKLAREMGKLPPETQTPETPE
jgi:hypothetical protein